MTCNFAQTIIDQSQAYPSKIAVRDGYQDLSYKDLSIRIRQVSNGLRSLGLRKGNHVIITMEDCVDWPVVFLACIYSGIVSYACSKSI
jgi:long-subunit acyl-CoA synthetase (AMP-forming)